MTIDDLDRLFEQYLSEPLAWLFEDISGQDVQFTTRIDRSTPVDREFRHQCYGVREADLALDCSGCLDAPT